MLWIAVLCVFAVNLPCGAWRAHTRRWSLAWWLSIHAPLPIVVALRFAFRLGFALHTYPLLVAAYFLGQLAGSRLERRRLARAARRHQIANR